MYKNGNSSTATQTITVVDTIDPTVTAPTNQSFEATAIFTPLTELDYGTATATDIFTPVTITNNAPATFPLGDTTITWTATSARGGIPVLSPIRSDLLLCRGFSETRF